MSLIEVVTSHNIVVRFELASVMHRIAATFIDWFILGVFIFLFVLVAGNNEFLYWFFVFPIFFLYNFFWEVFNKGQSPGKMVLRIRVVTLKGRTPKVIDYFTRWIFRLVDIALTLGMLAIIYIASSGRGQRLGDLMAQTAVVKKRNDNSITLRSLIEIDKGNLLENDEIMYPNIATYSDDDMLLLKQALIRYKQSPSDTNKNVILRLSKSISKELKVKIEEGKILNFLDRVLYEYILITR